MNKIVWVEETPSTNTLLAEMIGSQVDQLPLLFALGARRQTAGRGQRGNSWVTEPEQNLTCSFFLPLEEFPAREQFYISEYFTLAVYDTLVAELAPEERSSLKIKWPNDIYYADSKLGGILIEHSLQAGEIRYSILGLGLNLNQTSFPSHLPNPISLADITKAVYSPQLMLEKLQRRLEELLPLLLLNGCASLHHRYIAQLYRGVGEHRFVDPQQGDFIASIQDVLPTGELVLCTQEGQERLYAFKEVIFPLSESN